VYNYSWKKFPFIWNEISLHIAYESDLKYVESVLRSVTEQEMGDRQRRRIRSFKDLVQHTPIDDVQIKEYPFVCFRTNTNTWVEAVVTYLVPPKEAASFRSHLLKQCS
jgi:hypothetical protein